MSTRDVDLRLLRDAHYGTYAPLACHGHLCGCVWLCARVLDSPEDTVAPATDLRLEADGELGAVSA